MSPSAHVRIPHITHVVCCSDKDSLSQCCCVLWYSPTTVTKDTIFKMEQPYHTDIDMLCMPLIVPCNIFGISFLQFSPLYNVSLFLTLTIRACKPPQQGTAQPVSSSSQHQYILLNTLDIYTNVCLILHISPRENYIKFSFYQLFG